MTNHFILVEVCWFTLRFAFPVGLSLPPDSVTQVCMNGRAHPWTSVTRNMETGATWFQQSLCCGAPIVSKQVKLLFKAQNLNYPRCIEKGTDYEVQKIQSSLWCFPRCIMFHIVRWGNLTSWNVFSREVMLLLKCLEVIIFLQR